ncbi:hypothetical protein A4A49_52668 [Nicotiana attenuata]|uniref:Uncharacterized protein n=1 Tax=Nicotiana attenuata TaxID=49451 RepID=A0A1J6IAE6_NICAT|nr:hypothetical protein A4A49_52668 [Nicotiana attenuata]
MPLSASVTTQEQQRDKFFMVLALKGLRSDLSPVRDQILASSTVPSLVEVSARLLRVGSETLDTTKIETSLLAVQNDNSQEKNFSLKRKGKSSRPYCKYFNKPGHTRQNMLETAWSTITY